MVEAGPGCSRESSAPLQPLLLWVGASARLAATPPGPAAVAKPSNPSAKVHRENCNQKCIMTHMRVYPVLNPAALVPRPRVGRVMLDMSSVLPHLRHLHTVDICKHCSWLYQGMLDGEGWAARLQQELQAALPLERQVLNTLLGLGQHGQ